MMMASTTVMVLVLACIYLAMTAHVGAVKLCKNTVDGQPKSPCANIPDENFIENICYGTYDTKTDKDQLLSQTLGVSWGNPSVNIVRCFCRSGNCGDCKCWDGGASRPGNFMIEKTFSGNLLSDGLASMFMYWREDGSTPSGAWTQAGLEGRLNIHSDWHLPFRNVPNKGRPMDDTSDLRVIGCLLGWSERNQQRLPGITPGFGFRRATSWPSVVDCTALWPAKQGGDGPSECGWQMLDFKFPDRDRVYGNEDYIGAVNTLILDGAVIDKVHSVWSAAVRIHENDMFFEDMQRVIPALKAAVTSSNLQLARAFLDPDRNDRRFQMIKGFRVCTNRLQPWNLTELNLAPGYSNNVYYVTRGGCMTVQSDCKSFDNGPSSTACTAVTSFAGAFTGMLGSAFEAVGSGAFSALSAVLCDQDAFKI